MPKNTILDGKWEDKADLDLGGANILGANGSYLLRKEENSLRIAVEKSKPEYLAYYGAQLVKVGDTTLFDSDRNLPATITVIGNDYAKNYLINDSHGGGAYLEVHDRPYFHMPLDKNARGYLILGKSEDKDNNEIKRVSAFKTPYGYEIHMAPWTIHADSFLTGRYAVIYSVTKAFSTVIIRHQDGTLAPIEFIKN